MGDAPKQKWFRLPNGAKSFVPGMVLEQVPAPDMLPSQGAPCSPCDVQRLLDSIAAALNTDTRPRLLLLTTLADFNPAYSLVSVIVEQAQAAALAGFRVLVLVNQGCNQNKLPKFSSGVDVLPIVPTVMWTEDKVNEAASQKLVEAMAQWFSAVMPLEDPLYVISHDIVFQSWFVTFARAVHTFNQQNQQRETPRDIRWYHLCHSSVGARPTFYAPDATWRVTLPPNHHLISLNAADIPFLQQYYQSGGTRIPIERMHTLLNSRDVRAFLRMPERASALTTRYGLHLADVTMVYPLSLPRAEEKGAFKVLALIGAIKRLGKNIRLLFITAHAQHQDALIVRIKEEAAQQGVAEETILTCDVFPETAGDGLEADDVRALWQVSNLFIFPTISEAGSLVLLEAALAGCHLVLNDSLPALRDYIPYATWVPWGSIKSSQLPFNIDRLAAEVVCAMEADTGAVLRRQMMRLHSLEAYGLKIKELLLGVA
jgi:hypothetical protein